MVYTCQKCLAKMHDDPPHFQIFYRDEESDVPDYSCIIIRCPVCGAIYVNAEMPESSRVIEGWYTNHPIRCFPKRIGNIIRR
jgi:hypothetical protein